MSGYMRLALSLASLVISALFIPASLQAADYFPWDMDKEWVYRDDAGITARMHVWELKPIEDGWSAVLEVTVSGGEWQGTRWYGMEKTAEGDLATCFERRLTPPDGSMPFCQTSYGPCVIELDVPVAVGAGWSNSYWESTICCPSWDQCVGNSYGTSFTWEVTGSLVIDTPLGPLAGWIVSPRFPSPFGVWCDGVGPLRLHDFTLVSYGRPVGTEETSWGALKKLYK